MMFDPDGSATARQRRAAKAALAAAPPAPASSASRDRAYLARRWLGMFRGDGRSLAEIAQLEGLHVDIVHAAIDELLRVETGFGVEGFLASRAAARERARDALRRRAPAEVSP